MKNLKNPAIIFIGFRRAEYAHIVLNTLRNNFEAQKSDLHIFVDGARENVENEKEQVAQMCKVAQDFTWAGNKVVHVSKQNKGLQMGVRHAIDTVFSDYKSAIIIEDDIATSPYLYKFFNQGLEMFADNQEVGVICGHCYPFSRSAYNPIEPYFLRHFACWGWASWRRSWEGIEWDTGKLITKLKATKDTKTLDFGNSQWVSGILDMAHNNHVDTWDVQVGVSLFLNKQLCLFPPETLTNNIGWRLNSLSTHVFSYSNINSPLAYTEFVIPSDIAVKESTKMRTLYARFACPLRLKYRFFVINVIRSIIYKVKILSILNDIRKKIIQKRKSKERTSL